MRIGLFIILSIFVSEAKSQSVFKEVFKAMGSRFEVSVVTENPKLAQVAIETAKDEIDRIEKLISSWDSNSQTSAINQSAGKKAVIVDQELYDLISRSIAISNITQGAFDISYASMDKLWYFDGRMKELPSENEIASSVGKIGFQKIKLDPNSRSVFLEQAGMKIGFGAIGKGYAARMAANKVKAMGIKGGLVNAGGDLFAWGFQADGNPWRIGLSDPKDINVIMAWLDIQDRAVVTSGDYERFVEFNNTRYAHIIDPRTGWPTTGIKSVTVICPDPEMADALATSIFVLGKENGLHLINQLPDVDCVIVDDNDKFHTSENLTLNFNKKSNP